MSTALRLSFDEYDQLVRNGLFELLPDRNVELIRGEIREMNPPGPRHENVTDILNHWSIRSTADDKVRVRVQNSIGLPQTDSAPQPDIAWVVAKDYSERRPQAEDVLLLIEVAHSSRQYDRMTKSTLYAEARIPEYWIVDVANRRIEVRREPDDATYGSVSTHSLNESVSPLCDQSVKLRVSMLF